ncbi:hypothetical protein Q7F05_19695 [Pseudomonas sp. Lb2C1-1]|uniref:hypothetical protein n=1 Tax=Pseudomonas TaxID=286 RepID=UPI00391AAAB5
MESTKVVSLLAWMSFIALVIFFLFKAIWIAWGDEAFISSILLWWSAGVLVIPSVVLPFVIAYRVVKVLSKKTSNLGIFAVAAALSIVISGASIMVSIQSTPGIGWRYVALSADAFDR